MIDTQEIIDICVANSYDLLTGRKSIEEILDSTETPYFLWNVIEEDLDQHDFNSFIDFMIEYYEELEHYERCSVLLNIKLNERNKCKRKIREANCLRKQGF
tara:strand:+ start:817 stop:1119 length:303 start_codon:yes stop_codon:yes gene_type:complete